MIIGDAGPLVALLNKRDRHHAACSRFMAENLARLHVPSLVVTEVCQLLETRASSRVEASFLRTAGSELRTLEPTSVDYLRMAELVEKYADLPLGAVDASVVALAERMGATRIATLDTKHFSIVRARHCGQFTLLPEQ